MKNQNVLNAFEIGKYISFLYRSGNYFFSHSIDNIDIGSGHIAMIFHLYRNPNVSQDELTKALEVDKATVTRGITKLEEAGAVIRTVDEHDKRIKRLQLSEKGVALYQELKSATNIWHHVLLSDFSEEEIATLEKAFDKMIFNARQFRESHCKANL